jgi:hypothetical protein
MEKFIPRIYKSCYDNLRKANIREPKIFVISNYEHEIGQFDDLMNAVLVGSSVVSPKPTDAKPLSHSFRPRNWLIKGDLPTYVSPTIAMLI